jgi:hypothetical protein
LGIAVVLAVCLAAASAASAKKVTRLEAASGYTPSNNSPVTYAYQAGLGASAEHPLEEQECKAEGLGEGSLASGTLVTNNANPATLLQETNFYPGQYCGGAHHIDFWVEGSWTLSLGPHGTAKAAANLRFGEAGIIEREPRLVEWEGCVYEAHKLTGAVEYAELEEIRLQGKAKLNKEASTLSSCARTVPVFLWVEDIESEGELLRDRWVKP